MYADKKSPLFPYVPFFIEVVNASSDQCRGWRKVVCYLIMPLVWSRSLSKGSDCDNLFLVKMGKIFVWKVKAIYLPLI